MPEGEEVAPDTDASSIVTDHEFKPRGEWWTTCKHCGLARAAHARSAAQSEDGQLEPLPVPEIDMSVAQEHMVSEGDRAVSFEAREEHGQHEMAAVGSVDHLQDEADCGRLQDLPHDILTRQQSIVDGERQEQHGDPVPNMQKIAMGWSEILDAQVTPHDVPLMMAWFKIVRESRHHLEDNIEDIEGYAEIARRTKDMAADRRSP